MRIAGIHLAVFALILAPPAFAAPNDLQVPAGKEWKHKATGVKFPAQLAGLDRQKITAMAGPETDVGANYWSADGADNVTVFLYRNVSGGVPVWFDRARSIIQLLPEKYPDPKSLGIRPFTPRGQSTASGLMELFTTGNQFKSTGVMVLPVNGFYAKIRATSSTRDAASLEQLMLAAVNSMQWSSRNPENAAIPIADCPAPLPERPAAKSVELNQEDRMMAALIGGVIAQSTALDKKPATATYCREPGPLQIPYGIYRLVGSDDSYMMALLDAGRAIFVGNSAHAQIMSELKKPARISVSLVEMERTSTFGDFATLPLPEQALEQVQRGTPLSVASTWGKKRELSINSGQ